MTAIPHDASKWGFLREVASHPIASLRTLRRWKPYEREIEALIARGDDISVTDPEFQGAYHAFLRLSRGSRRDMPARPEDLLPCRQDASIETPFDRHYLYHPAWAARVLARTKPKKHTDISSALHFCATVSAFVPVDFYDYRPAPVRLENLRTGAVDLLRLPFPDESIESLSCMHVIEHIGLGRYGDALDPDADLKSIGELLRVLEPGGDLLMVTPVGIPRIQFNAHRVYDPETFRGYFAKLDLLEFGIVPDGEAPDGIVYDPPAKLLRMQKYACGCYWFRKPAAPQALAGNLTI